MYTVHTVTTQYMYMYTQTELLCRVHGTRTGQITFPGVFLLGLIQLLLRCNRLL